ncbi:MAG: T9SS type A sorting domain-containing protein [Ignavibacteriaceae bacterium]
MKLAPLSQYDIKCTIKASTMTAKDYIVSLLMTRYFTLDPASKTISKNIKFSVPTVSSARELKHRINYSLYQNYPNPFNPLTRIKYSIANSSQVELVVFNTIGKEITRIVNEYQNAGNYEVSFNASEFPSGIYYYKLKAGNYSSVKKLVVLK